MRSPGGLSSQAAASPPCGWPRSSSDHPGRMVTGGRRPTAWETRAAAPPFRVPCDCASRTSGLGGDFAWARPSRSKWAAFLGPLGWPRL